MFTILEIIHVKTEHVQLNVRKLKILAGSVIVKLSGFQDAFVDLKTSTCDLRFEFIHSILIKSHSIRCDACHVWRKIRKQLKSNNCILVC